MHWFHHLTHRHVTAVKEGVVEFVMCTSRITSTCSAHFTPEGDDDSIHIVDLAVMGEIAACETAADARYLAYIATSA